MKLQRVGDRQQLEVDIIARSGSSIRARIGETEINAEIEPLADGSAILKLGDRRYRVFGTRRGESMLVTVGPRGFEFKPIAARRVGAKGGLLITEITAPMPGKVLKILVAGGDTVKEGDPLIVLEAMKMETVLSAESAAKVNKVRVGVGDMVDGGVVLLELSPLADSSAPQSEAEGP